MRYQLTFRAPEDRPAFGDYTEYRFPYDIVEERYVDTAEEEYNTSHNNFSVRASRTLITIWGVDDSELGKLLFEHGRHGLFRKIRVGREYDSWSLRLNSRSDGVEPNRYDIRRIPPINGATYFIEVDETIDEDNYQIRTINDGSDSSFKMLNDALLSSFRTRADLRRMLRLELNVNLDIITSNTNLENTVFELTEWAESKGKLDDLILGASRDNPENPELKAFVECHYCSYPDSANKP